MLERREYPRIDMQIPVEILDRESDVFPCKALNISRAGLQVECDRSVVEHIIPRNFQAIPELHVCFTLPAAGNSPEGARVVARCRVIITRRVAQEEYQIGLRYTGFEGDGYERLEDYIIGCA